MAKRLFDLFFSTLALITLSPILLVILLWILLADGEPAIFRQERIGLHGRPFDIYKFRTMRPDAEKVGAQLTTGDDSRITSQGRFLRRYKLDELPQFINVWVGDMSVVGPRPEVARYMDAYPHEVRTEILSVRPGITDLASIKFRDENALLTSANDPEHVYITDILPIKQAYYLEYVRHHTLWMDIKIIWKTISSVLSKDRTD